MSKFSSIIKYWNNNILEFNNSDFKKNIIESLCLECEYDILSITNNGKKKFKKNLCIKDRDLYTPSMGINKELPYLKKFKHLISINPPGKKYLLYLKNFNNKNQAIFINRYKDVHINYEHRMYKLRLSFDESLFEGTLIDGQAVKKKDGKWYFVMNDIYMLKGCNVMFNSFEDRLNILKNLFENEANFKINDNKYTKSFINNNTDSIYFEIKSYFNYEYSLDLVKNYYRFFNYFDSDKKFKNLDNNEDGFNGDIPKGIIFTNTEINATCIYYILPLQKSNTFNKEKLNIYNKNVGNSNKILKNVGNFYFKLKKTKYSDVYELFCNKDNYEIYYNNCIISTLSNSQLISSYFKNNELDFEIDLEECLNEYIYVECIFDKFNKWEPIKRVNKIDLSDINIIKKYEYENNIIIKNIPEQKLIDYDKNNYLVYNEKNIKLDKKFIEDLLKKYKVVHVIKNMEIIQTAFVHKSYSLDYFIKQYSKDKTGKTYISSKIVYNLLRNNKKDNRKDCLELFKKSYERLEWFGDAKLEDIISTYLEKRYIYEDEGFLTTLRSKLVRKQTLGYIGYILGFSRYIILSKHMDVYENGRMCIDILEDCFEALIGALYTEFTEQNCIYKLEEFIINLFESEINFSDLIMNNDNYKAIIMEYFHKEYNKNPYYKEANDSGEKGIFKMYIINPKNKAVIGSGEHKIKKKAEQLAAFEGLKYLGLIE